MSVVKAQQEQAVGKGTMALIAVLSVAIPVVVAILLFLPEKGLVGIDVSWLPHFHAIVNSMTAFVLIAALMAVKTGNINAHRGLMYSAFIMGCLFLVSYVLYHAQAENTLYGDLNHDHLVDDAEKAAAGSSRLVYLGILLSHIVMAAVVVPFVLLSVYYGYTGRNASHRKVSKYTWPIWFYVSVTGVVVYLMISPFYSH